MKNSELLKRIEELEARVKGLEARSQISYMNYQEPFAYRTISPTVNPMTDWLTKPSTS